MIKNLNISEVRKFGRRTAQKLTEKLSGTSQEPLTAEDEEVIDFAAIK